MTTYNPYLFYVVFISLCFVLISSITSFEKSWKEEGKNFSYIVGYLLGVSTIIANIAIVIGWHNILTQ